MSDDDSLEALPAPPRYYDDEDEDAGHVPRSKVFLGVRAVVCVVYTTVFLTVGTTDGQEYRGGFGVVVARIQRRDG